MLAQGSKRASQPLPSTLLLFLASSAPLGCPPQVDEAFALVRERVRLELQSQEQLARIRGMLEPLLTAAATTQEG